MQLKIQTFCAFCAMHQHAFSLSEAAQWYLSMRISRSSLCPNWQASRTAEVPDCTMHVYTYACIMTKRYISKDKGISSASVAYDHVAYVHIATYSICSNINRPGNINLSAILHCSMHDSHGQPNTVR